MDSLRHHHFTIRSSIATPKLSQFSDFHRDVVVQAKHQERVEALGDRCKSGCDVDDEQCNCKMLFGCVREMTSYGEWNGWILFHELLIYLLSLINLDLNIARYRGTHCWGLPWFESIQRYLWQLHHLRQLSQSIRRRWRSHWQASIPEGKSNRCKCWKQKHMSGCDAELV